MKGSYIVLLLICTGIISCTMSKQYTPHTFDVQSTNFDFLKEALEGKRVVSLGESSHGLGSLQSLKVEMIKYLHQEMGYEVIMMPTSYGDAKVTWYYNDVIQTSVQARDKSLFKNFRTEEILPLFQYIVDKSKAQDSLIYSGYDSQIASKAFKFDLGRILQKIEIKIIQDSIKSGLESLDKMSNIREDEGAWNRLHGKVVAGADLAISVLDDNIEEILEEEIATQREIDYINKALIMLRASLEYKFDERYSKGLAIRDSLMAISVIDQLETEYKDKKVIIWGHNGHIDRKGIQGNTTKWMGHFLAEKYRDTYYALGMYSKKGMIYMHWQNRNQPFDINKDAYIEKILFDQYKGPVFVDLPKYKEGTEWYQNQVLGFEPEAGGSLTFIPTERFDGVLLLPETEMPTFKVRSER